MAEPRTNELMEKIVSLCKRKGFIFQSSEIYGGINGFWDYGPLGAELKRNVKELWWNSMTRFRDDVVGLEATIIMDPQIWKASGHVETFVDMMVEDPLTNRRYRSDQVEAQDGIVYYFTGASNMSPSEFGFIQGEKEEIKKHLKQKRDLNELKKLGEEFLTSFDPEKQKIGRILLEYASLKSQIKEPFSVLLPSGKPPESAFIIAGEYYEKRGMDCPWPIKSHTEKVIGDIRHSPENGARLTDPRPFNLMFKTYVGPVESDEGVAYLRPETAQAIFVQFKNVVETSRQMPPFGIAQIGKAFRNEVTPRNFTFRSREFEQMELEFFIKPDEAIEAISGNVAEPGDGHPGEPQANWGWKTWHKYWVEERIKFYEGIGLPRKSLVEYWQKPDELAHYSRACVDILYKFPFGKRDEKGELIGEELEGVAARSDFDLSQHERFSGKPMGVFDEELRAAWAKLPKEKQDSLWRSYYDNRKKYLTKMARPNETSEQIEKEATDDANGLAKGQYIPHVIEPSAGVDRLILALISNAYDEDPVTDEKGKTETRVVLRFHPRIAPIKVAVFPLLKNKPELVKKALEVRDLLRRHMTVFYDEAGAIGRRYRRQDEAGTPFGVTIDFDTLGEKPEMLNTVTLRERDTMRQTRVKIEELVPLLLEKIR
jgi:glycyl-tRNA synthetase